MVPSSDDTRDAERPLGQIAARGARLAIVGWGASQGLNFAAYIVLARLLDPGDFGTFAAGSILIAFGVLFAESGTMAALISRRDRIDEAASTAFFSLVVSGVLLSLVSLAASPLVGLFFQNHRAGVVAAALSGWLFLRAMTIVPDSLLQRRFSYARRVAVDPLGAIAFAAVAIATCATGAGVWGLVLGHVRLRGRRGGRGVGLRALPPPPEAGIDGHVARDRRPSRGRCWARRSCAASPARWT